jgi:lysophospholipase L1-like esterase
LRILAIGSSSTVGVGASSPSNAYPARLAIELRSLLPETFITVESAGITGERAAGAALRIRETLNTSDFDVVIWQLGTNDARAQVAKDDLVSTVTSISSFLRESGTDLIVMDPQFYPGSEIDAIRSYVGIIDAYAVAHEIMLFRRHSLMETWARELGPLSMLATDSFHLNDRGYACVASVLAREIVRNAGKAP